MRPIVVLALVSVLAAGCASTPPDQDPVQIRLNDLDSRVSKVERVMSNQSLLQMAQQVDTLQADVRDLRGQIDDLQNANRELRKQQHDFYTDLDKRVGALEHGGAAGGGSAPGSGTAATVPRQRSSRSMVRRSMPSRPAATPWRSAASRAFSSSIPPAARAQRGVLGWERRTT